MPTKKWFPPIVLTFTGLLLYLPSLFGKFIWDDEQLIYQNQYVLNFRLDKFFTDSATAGRGIISNYYRPLQSLLYASLNLMFGLHPFYYHLAAIALHLAAAITIYYFFTLLSKKKLISFLIALFFLIHPVQTEAVSYISGLSDPLFVLLGFLSLLCYLRRRYPLALLYFFLSLLAKETGLVFAPLVFFLWFFKDRAQSVKRLVPYFMISLAYLAFHFRFINQFNSVVGWGNTPYAHSLLLRLATFIQNLYLYLSLAIFPKDLFMERDLTLHLPTTILTPPIIVFIFVNLVLLVFLTRQYQQKKNFLPLFCFSGFYLSFLPVSGLVLINGIFYEHFLYLPLVFFAAFFLFSFEKKLTRPVLFLLAVYFLLLSARTVLRELDWVDNLRFYRQTLAHAPASIRIRNNLGMAESDAGQFDQAISLYQETLKLAPQVPNLYHNLANAYQSQGDTQNAEKYYLQAIAVDQSFFYSYVSLYNLYQQTGQKDKAKALLSRYPQFFHQ